RKTILPSSLTSDGLVFQIDGRPGDSNFQDHQEALEILNLAGFKDAKINNNPLINLILQHDLNCVADNDPIQSDHLSATFPHPLLYNKDPGIFDTIINRI
ncbi:7413_t:CDS:1, partial [Ambispora gerdemannii]